MRKAMSKKSFLKMPLVAVCLFALQPLSVIAQQPAAPAFAVRMTIDVSQTKGELKPIWRFFGADEPNYAYMKNGKELLGELGKLQPAKVYFRTHNLLTT